MFQEWILTLDVSFGVALLYSLLWLPPCMLLTQFSCVEHPFAAVSEANRCCYQSPKEENTCNQLQEPLHNMRFQHINPDETLGAVYRYQDFTFAVSHLTACTALRSAYKRATHVLRSSQIHETSPFEHV